MSFKNDIFKLVRGFGYKVKMYDDNGKGPILNPDEFTYLYGAGEYDTIMLVYDYDAETSYNYLTLYKSISSSQSHFMDFLQAIKTLSLKNAFSVKIKNFGRNIKPKDFSSLPSMTKTKYDIGESFSVNGSKNTSKHSKDNARVKIHHKNVVDEKKKNSRSRNIKEVFVETKSGEKRKISCNNLSVAKSVANYVNSGGNLYDDTVQNLVLLGEDFIKIKSLKNKNLTEYMTEGNDEYDFNFVMKEASRKMSSFFRKLANRKKVLEIDELEYLNSPDFEFSKNYFENKINDGNLVETLARSSLFLENEREKMYNDNLDYLFGPDDMNRVYAKDLMSKNQKIVERVFKKLKSKIEGKDQNIDLDFARDILEIYRNK